MEIVITFSEVLLFSNPNKKRSKTHSKLQIISKSIDFVELEEFVKKLYKSNKDTGGRPPININTKIKMLFLQYLYNMSDEILVDSLLANFDFQEFCNIGVEENIPDFTSHWRFKERLIKTNNLDKIFNLIQAQLFKKGINIKQDKISIIDATIIYSSNKPLSKNEREELNKTPSKQKDTDATSTSKNSKYYFGYKGHVNVDGESKLVQKNKPLNTNKIEINKKWSKIRSRVEHCFAYLKTKLIYNKARAKNLLRNKLSFIMNIVIYNTLRTKYLLTQIQKQGS